MSLYKELIALEASGFSEDELDRFAKQRIAVLQGSGFGPADIAKELGRPIPELLPSEETVTTAPQPLAVEEQDPSEFVASEMPISAFPDTRPEPREETPEAEPVQMPDLMDPQSFFTSEMADWEFDRPITNTRTLESYWKDVVKEVKIWSVGEKAEWGEYWERGLGKSTINLAVQYHSRGEVGYDALAALSPEPEDTGHLELWLESITNIGADLPVFVPAALAGTSVTGGNVFAGGFAAGFVNESIKSMYIDALQRGEVNNWQDWWNSFVEHGFKEGMKSGVTLGVGVAAPGWIGAKSLAGKYATQYAAFTGVGALLEGQVPTSDELINTALVLGTFGGLEGGAKATRMFTDRVKKTSKGTVEVLQEVELNPRMREDLASDNIQTFRDKPEPTEAIQPFKADSNPKPQIPEVNYEVRPSDIANIRNEAVPTQRYNEMRESGLNPRDAAEAAKTEPVIVERPSSEAVANVLDRVEFEVPRPREAMSDIRSNFVTSYIDRLHPVLNAVRNYEKAGGTFETTMTPYTQMRLQPGMIGRGMYTLQYGTLDFKTLNRNGPGLMEIMRDVKTKNDFRDATAYLTAKRAVEKSEQGKETGVPIEDARATVAQLEPKYGKMGSEIVAWQNRIVDYLVDSGVISREVRDAMIQANRDYVPFYRVMDQSVNVAANNFSSAVRNPFKKFKGSERKIMNPIESVHLNALSHIAIAERNKAYTSFIEMVEARPDAFPGVSKVPAKVRGTKIKPEELPAAFDGPIKPEFADGMTVFRRNGQVVSNTEIAVFRDGKREIWEVGPEIAGALRDMNGYQANMFLRFLGTPTRLLRAGATLAPDFMVRNLARDALSAGIFSQRGFIPLYHKAMGFWHMIRTDNLSQVWTKSGAMQSMLVSFDRNYFSRDMKKHLTRGKVRNLVTNPLEALRIASEFFESSGRVGQYKLAFNQLKRRKKLTDRDIVEQAGFESRDITIDFAKMGTQMQALNMISAFFNARVQGYAKIYEAFQQRPAQTSAKIFAYITLPSMLLWYKNHDDPRYQQLPRWQKDLFWIFITGDGTVDEPENYHVWRIPKPFELGLVFGTGAERMMDFVETKDPGHLARFFGEFAKDAALSMGPIPDFAKPFVEFKANKDFFTDRPIVSRGMENMLPEFQYDEYTSASAKALGKTINEITFGYGPSSPQKIDHLISSWTGTLGRYALEAADKALLESGLVVEPTKPAKTLADLPVIRAFLVRKPTGSSEHIEEFYRKYDKIAGRMATFEKLQKEGRLAEARDVLSDTDLNLVPLLGYRDSMANISKTIRLVHAGPMTADEKRQMIDQLYLTMIEIAKAGVEFTEGKID
mgnify:CR=1 FL=1